VLQMTIKLNISARNFQEHVNYQNKVISKELGGELNKANFMVQNIEEVIHQASKEEKKEIKKTLKAIRIAGVSMLVILLQNQTSFAETIGTEAEIITPDQVTAFMFKLALIALSATVGLASIMLMVAGSYRMFRKRKEAKIWTTDILKGFTQALVAIPVIYLIFYLAFILFGDLENFVTTFFAK
jgi:hypothetical protein